MPTWPACRWSGSVTTPGYETWKPRESHARPLWRHGIIDSPHRNDGNHRTRKPSGGPYVFSVAAAILAAVEGGILPHGKKRADFRRLMKYSRRLGWVKVFPPGRMPSSTAGET